MIAKRPPIVLIYGYRGAALGFRDIKATLESQGFDVYIPTIPPFGCKDKLKKYTPDSYSDYLARWLKKNKLDSKKPVIIGHSMGSILASAFAERHPEMIADKVILLAPIAKKVPFFIRFVSPLVTIFPNKLISFITTKYLIAPKYRKRFKEIYQYCVDCGAECASRMDDFAAAKFSSSWAITDFDFKQDALFIAGGKDRVTSLSKMTRVAAARGVKIRVIPEVGHLLNYENPKKVVSKIVGFIEN